MTTGPVTGASRPSRLLAVRREPAPSGGRGRRTSQRPCLRARPVRSRPRSRRPGTAARPDQHPDSGRHAARLVHRSRPGRQLGPARRGRVESVRRGRLAQPANALLRDPHRTGRHRPGPRLLPGPAPLDPAAPAATNHTGGRHTTAGRPQPAARATAPVRPGAAARRPDPAAERHLPPHRRRADATTRTPRTTTPRAEGSSTSSAPAPLPAPPPPATPRRCYCDLDHTVAYPDGPTCQCNLAPKCRRHHRCKQAAGWTVEQPEPGVLRWTVPSGRSYTTTPTSYDL